MKDVNAVSGKMHQNVEYDLKIIHDEVTKAADIFDTEIRLPRRWSSMNCMSDPETSSILPFYTEHVDRNRAKSKFNLRRHKWKNTESAAASTPKVLNDCDQLFHSNTSRILQILVALPVTAATAECSFSTLRHPKTDLPAQHSVSRKARALLYTHQEVAVEVEEAIHRFALPSHRHSQFLV